MGCYWSFDTKLVAGKCFYQQMQTPRTDKIWECTISVHRTFPDFVCSWGLHLLIKTRSGNHFGVKRSVTTHITRSQSFRYTTCLLSTFQALWTSTRDEIFFPQFFEIFRKKSKKIWRPKIIFFSNFFSKVCKMQFGHPVGPNFNGFVIWSFYHGQKTTFMSKTRKIVKNFTKTTRRKKLSDQIIWITWFSWTLPLSGCSPIFSVRTNLVKFLIHLE